MGGLAMSVDERLGGYFGDYRSPDLADRWETTMQQLVLGSTVSGIVVSQEQFGVFLDIGVAFPALILVPKLKDADKIRYTSVETYPAVGTRVQGRIYVFVDDMRQIGITQLAKEEMLGE